MFLSRLDKWNGTSLNMPGENDLGCRLSFGFRDLFDDLIVEDTHIFVSVFSQVEMSGSNRCIAFKIYAVFGVELFDSSLLEIWMTFDLIKSWPDLAPS